MGKSAWPAKDFYKKMIGGFILPKRSVDQMQVFPDQTYGSGSDTYQ
jgi:hypothetical protein